MQVTPHEAGPDDLNSEESNLSDNMAHGQHGLTLETKSTRYTKRDSVSSTFGQKSSLLSSGSHISSSDRANTSPLLGLQRAHGQEREGAGGTSKSYAAKSPCFRPETRTQTLAHQPAM